MNVMDMDSVIAVFTAKSVESILEEGGTSSWALDRNHARQCEFAVCTRNAHADWVEGNEPHGSAFLVGRIKDVVPRPNGRWLVQFSEFARVDVPNVWQGWRNPVRYTSLSELGIEPNALQFQPMPNVPSQLVASEPLQGTGGVMQRDDGAPPLTISAAKEGLAKTFSVSPDQIEITIRG
jgi:hypothetical protein